MFDPLTALQRPATQMVRPFVLFVALLLPLVAADSITVGSQAYAQGVGAAAFAITKTAISMVKSFGRNVCMYARFHEGRTVSGSNPEMQRQ